LVKHELSDQADNVEIPKITLLRYVEKLIEDTKTGRRVNPKTKQRFALDSHKSYRNTFKALERFNKYCKRIVDFEDIDLGFYNDFKEYLMDVEKVSNNYFGLHIKNIKLFLNESLESGLHSNQKHNHKQFTKLQNETDNIYLNKQQLEELYRLDLSKNSRLDRVRDLFLVGCWTGLRFSDFNAIEPKNIRGDFVEIQAQKTGEVVIIPIHKTIKAIMKKYKDLTPNSLPPAISNVNMNKYLKELGEEAKFNELQQIRVHKGGTMLIKIFLRMN
jgi:integrase